MELTPSENTDNRNFCIIHICSYLIFLCYRRFRLPRWPPPLQLPLCHHPQSTRRIAATAGSRQSQENFRCRPTRFPCCRSGRCPPTSDACLNHHHIRIRSENVGASTEHSRKGLNLSYNYLKTCRISTWADRWEWCKRSGLNAPRLPWPGSLCQNSLTQATAWDDTEEEKRWNLKQKPQLKMFTWEK